MKKEGAKRLGGWRRFLAGKYFPYVLLAPGLLVIFSFAFFPLFYALRLSLCEAVLTSPAPMRFVGLDNFRRALDDPMFWRPLWKTAVFTASAVSLEMVLGVAIAFLLNSTTRLQGLARGLLLLPMTAAPVAVGLTWRYMYHTDFGIFNHVMSLLRLGEHNWLGERTTAMLSIVAFDVWQWTPFVAFVVLAALQSLPKEPFEAAEVDGASAWQVLRKLTFPMISPVLVLVLLLRTIDAVRLYDPIFALTRGGPGTTTETLSWYLYKIGFKFFDMGYAAAISFLFLYVVVILCALTIRALLAVPGERS